MMDIYCINLKKRQDRLELLKKNIPADFNLIIIEAVEHKNGSIGCGLSHQKIIKLAIEKNMDRVLVIEDDNVFSDNCIDILTKVLYEIPVYDILLGGAHYITYPTMISANLFKIRKFSGTNFILYNKSSYKTILNWTIGHIDNYYSFLSDSGHLNVFITFPFLGKTESEYSDVKKKKINYKHLFDKYEKILSVKLFKS